MSDLLNQAQGEDYNASSIEVLEGLEPVRKRPGMYIGGTDERALHHLVAEVLDNSMDEAVAGHANRIEVELHADYSVTVRDNGRGIPVDPHPKFPEKSALEVILCTLHAGGKFGGKAYQTSGGLHGVGAFVVNALSDLMVVQVARNKELYEQRFSRGIPQGPIEKIGAAPNRRGTTVTFHADDQIFGSHRFKPARLFKSIRSKAYLFSGVEIRWKTAIDDNETPLEATFHFHIADTRRPLHGCRRRCRPTSRFVDRRFRHHNAFAFGFHHDAFRPPVAKALLYVARAGTSAETQCLFAVTIAHLAVFSFPMAPATVTIINHAQTFETCCFLYNTRGESTRG